MQFPTPRATFVHDAVVAQDAAGLQTKVRREFLAIAAPDRVIRGLSLGGNTDGKMFSVTISAAIVVLVDADIEIPIATARVTCFSSALSTTALQDSFNAAIARIDDEVALTPGSSAVIYDVLTDIGGAGGMVMGLILWQQVPPPPP